jgi:hypothetical protein
MKLLLVFVHPAHMPEPVISMNLQSAQQLEFNLLLDMQKVVRCTLPGVTD